MIPDVISAITSCIPESPGYSYQIAGQGKEEIVNDIISKEELVEKAEAEGIWIKSRGMHFHDNGDGTSTLKIDISITPAGDNVLRFAKVVMEETEKRLNENT